MQKDNSFAMIALVAIVAVVGLVVMIRGARLPSDFLGKDIGGQATKYESYEVFATEVWLNAQDCNALDNPISENGFDPFVASGVSFMWTDEVTDSRFKWTKDSRMDLCADNTQLYEFGCETTGGKVRLHTVNCFKGCTEGACIP